MTAPEPIVVAVDLALSAEQAFTAFTEGFAEWWPTATHSMSRDPATRCRLEARLGGAIEELAPDGTRHVWGEIEALEPGRRILFSWYPGREPESAQWVEIEFEARRRGSRVTLTHGGWEALGEIGPLLRQEYLPGWRLVIEKRFADFSRRPR